MREWPDVVSRVHVPCVDYTVVWDPTFGIQQKPCISFNQTTTHQAGQLQLSCLSITSLRTLTTLESLFSVGGEPVAIDLDLWLTLFAVGRSIKLSA